jgi:hypothetical protein
MVAALVFARAGNTKQSQDLVEKVNQLLPNDFTIQAFNLPATRGAIKLGENDPAAAIEILKSVTPYDLAISDSFDTVYPAYLRGIEFRKVLDHPAVGSAGVIKTAKAEYAVLRKTAVQ